MSLGNQRTKCVDKGYRFLKKSYVHNNKKPKYIFSTAAGEYLSERARQHSTFVQLLEIPILLELQSMLPKSHFTNMQHAAIEANFTYHLFSVLTVHLFD